MRLTRIHRHVIDIFKLNVNKKTGKGWIMSPEACPWCGKADEHFGIRLNEPSGRYNNHISYHCFKCNETGGEFKLLREIDQLHILKYGDYIDHSKKIESRLSKIDDISDINISSPTKPPPLGFKRISDSEYLKSRGFEDWQFELYTIGETYLDYRLKDYVIFLIIENGECKGSVARSIRSKKWVDDYNETIKHFNTTRPVGTKKKQKYLRWRNDDAEFDKLLMGIDEVTEQTKEVILVEGVTDKANVDKLLRLNLESSVTKCLCTFGKKISDEQIMKLKLWGVNIEKVYVLYDPDAVKDSKSVGEKLGDTFLEVLIGFTKSNDPGDMDFVELMNVLDKAESPMNFRINKIQKKKLI